MSDWRDRTIAVDGPAASGKGTLAHRLAGHFGYAHLDTGKLYRAVARALVEADGDPADEMAAVEAARTLDAARTTPQALGDTGLATEEVGAAASQVASYQGVRDALYDLQRRFAARPPDGARGAVLDGRDIGTVICPEATIKFFLIAAPEVRAERRHKELLDRGEASIYARILSDIAIRDRRDATRDVAPTRAAADAIEIDTSSLDADAVFAAALAAIARAQADGA